MSFILALIGLFLFYVVYVTIIHVINNSYMMHKNYKTNLKESIICGWLYYIDDIKIFFKNLFKK